MELRHMDWPPLGIRLRNYTAMSRLMQKVHPEPNSGCWLWIGGVNQAGYGVILYGSGEKNGLAHRLSWRLHKGPISDGLHVLHRCDVPCCVNPDHLFLGTNKDNVDDKVSKGRAKGSIGEENPNATLCEIDIPLIMKNSLSCKDIGKIYGVSGQTIWRIKNGKNWTFLTKSSGIS